MTRAWFNTRVMNYSTQGSVRTQSTRFLLLLLLLQAVYLLFFRHHGPDREQIQRVTSNRHKSITAVLSSKVTGNDFGVMGKKVAALANLAEHHVASPSIESPSLDELVAQQFPWWNMSTLPYIPWERKRRHWFDPKPLDGQTGIVIPTGNGNAREAVHLIALLRNVHKSKLPIDIAYVGDDDLTPRIRAFMARLGEDINFLDLTKFFNNTLTQMGSYATKPFALIASRYPHTIMMDADAVPFSPPDRLFKDFSSLRETGTLFLHDRSVTLEHKNERHDWIFAQLQAAGQLPSPHLKHSSLFYRGYIEEEADSAVVCIDKSRVKLYMAMLFACWMNIGEAREVNWNLWHFEKESYWLATELSGVPYSFEPWSSARMAQSQPNGVPLLPNVGLPSISGRSARMRSGLRGAQRAKDDRDINRQESPAHRICTSHMVHATANGQEPWFANGGLWLDKRDRNLGLANWTHWYLGGRIDKAVTDVDPYTINPHDTSVPKWGDETIKQLGQQKEKIMGTQPFWNIEDWDADAKECPRHDETGWRPLSRKFREMVQRLIAEVRDVNERYNIEVVG